MLPERRAILLQILKRDAKILERLARGPACDNENCCPPDYLPNEKRVYSGDRPA